MTDRTMQKLNSFVRTWLPIIITIGGLITGYYVFKAETHYQFELQAIKITALKSQVEQLSQDAVFNRRDWQQDIERQLNRAREDIIRQHMRLKVLERRPLSEDGL